MIEEFDKELKIWTVALDEINMYGEGSTKEEALEDLINGIIEFTEIYKKNTDRYSLLEPEIIEYMRKIIDCNNNREKIKLVLESST